MNKRWIADAVILYGCYYQGEGDTQAQAVGEVNALIVKSFPGEMPTFVSPAKEGDYWQIRFGGRTVGLMNTFSYLPEEETIPEESYPYDLPKFRPHDLRR